MAQTAPRSPTLQDAVRMAIDARVQDIHVALPGRIEEWDATKQKAVVKPLIMRRVATEDGTELLEELPAIPDVPVCFPRSQQFFISFPLAVGDFVLIVFMERSMDRWLASASGADADPDDFRTHDLTDAVAIPMLYPFTKALQQADASNAVFGKDAGGVQIHVTPSAVVEVKLGGGAADMKATLFEALKTIYDAHTHPTGTGPSGVPVVPLPATVGASKLKIQSG